MSRSSNVVVIFASPNTLDHPGVAINLGLTKAAKSCPGTTYAMLSCLQAWHVGDETCRAALVELVSLQAPAR